MAFEKVVERVPPTASLGVIAGVGEPEVSDDKTTVFFPIVIRGVGAANDITTTLAVPPVLLDPTITLEKLRALEGAERLEYHYKATFCGEKGVPSTLHGLCGLDDKKFKALGDALQALWPDRATDVDAIKEVLVARLVGNEIGFIRTQVYKVSDNKETGEKVFTPTDFGKIRGRKKPGGNPERPEYGAAYFKPDEKGRAKMLAQAEKAVGADGRVYFRCAFDEATAF